MSGQPRQRAGSELLPGYRVVAHLSRGERLDVYHAWSAERRCHCVVKALRPEEPPDGRAARRLLREGRLLRRLTHPHLVRAWEVHAGARPAVVLEPLSGQTLAALIEGRRRRLAAIDVAHLGAQLCAVVGYLHLNGVLHLDLKPDNVIANGGRATLLDLSVARGPGRVRAGLGTPSYLSPEQARGGRVDAAADVWGVGVVLREAATGVRLERAARRRDPGSGAPSVRRDRRLPGLLADAIDACLSPDPRARPSVSDLAERLDAVIEVGS